MLEIYRKVGEEIRIGDDITIDIREIYRWNRNGPWKVKLGIDAPPDIKINRSEIVETELRIFDGGEP